MANLNDDAGQTVTLSALLQRSVDRVAVPGKTITFKIDSTSVGTDVTATNGVAKVKYTIPVSLGAGSHVITANFAGDNDYAPNSGMGSLTVYFNTRVTVSSTKAIPGRRVFIQALIRRDPDGSPVPGKTITFKLDSASAGTAVTAGNGVATLHYIVPTSLTSGNHTITAAFAGDAVYQSSSQTGTLKVQRH